MLEDRQPGFARLARWAVRGISTPWGSGIGVLIPRTAHRDRAYGAAGPAPMPPLLTLLTLW